MLNIRQASFSTSLVLGLSICLAALGCAGPRRGPDKQVESGVSGMLMGAGAGAVTGAQIGAGAGPGVAVGAGFGAALGTIQGFFKDMQEESMLDLAVRTKEAREVAYAQEVLVEHFKRRAELHPTRDIFPADVFFESDNVKVKPEAYAVVKEIVRLNKNRMPWSRLIVTSYIKSADEDSAYAKYLAEHRAENLSNLLIKYGIQPRRLTARPIVMKEAILLDPADRRDRYSQAIELTAADR